MRIVGGELRGRPLKGPGTGERPDSLRPTTDRVRESLFNLLRHGGYAEPAVPEGALVLDLFAGTGALGLEALSRGAQSAVFVENDRNSLALLRANVASLGVGDRASVIAADALCLGAASGPGADLVLLDPPYSKGLGERALTAAISGGWIAGGALVVWEESRPPVPPAGMMMLDRRAYGNTRVHIFRYGTA